MNRRAITSLPIVVEYTGRNGKRTTRTLPNSLAARTFYAAALAKGQAPRVLGAASR